MAAPPASLLVSSLFSVAGKNVLVTGGSRGIGYMIAKGFCENGANVLLTSRDEKACAEAAATLDCHFVASNVNSRQGCEALAEYVSQLFGDKLHVLVNNAGTSWGEPLERVSRTNWGFDKVFDLNVKGMFYLTRSCITMLEQASESGNPSRIINIGSVAGIVPQPTPTHAYDLSKAAVHHLTRKFASELAPQGITVNAVAPGFVPSRMSAGLATWGADEQVLSSIIPLQRMGNEADMAGACLYLASPAASWCTGVILPVDGGHTGAAALHVVPNASNL